MESFVVRPMTWPGLRLFSRNPLVRASDRIESAVIAFVLLFVIIATAGAGVFGTAVYDAKAQTYREQAQTRHAVVATAVADSESAVSPETRAFTVQARWRLSGIDHADLLGWNSSVKVGDQLQIWVDDRGNRVEQPSPVERAAVDALSVAAIGWLIVVAAAAQVALVVRAHTIRMRDAQWERDIRCLVDEDGGRTNRPQ
ncbi:MAG: hypothetical protein JOY55_13115 [Mycobacterium sp.]|nr:hypothetical protein [Mycobacterium sp.]MBV8292723.1 hypothetical protein [Mycobacterium sp.]